jgi:SAM-dependent methyltransferase
MPDLRWNLRFWDCDYDWKDGGEEWSVGWGSSEAQWFGTLLPRIHGFLPARRILEIGPGFGRWTRFLLPQCSRYVGIDLSPKCVEACQKRFRHLWKIHFYHNDGLSLDRARGKFDFVFSFDSLVHAEVNVFEAYIPQILAKLNENGLAFVHHSNLRASGASVNDHARAETVDYQVIAEVVRRSGGRVLVQELVNWGGEEPIDCFTLFGLGRQSSPAVVIPNREFMQQARFVKEIYLPYAVAGGRRQ